MKGTGGWFAIYETPSSRRLGRAPRIFYGSISSNGWTARELWHAVESISRSRFAPLPRSCTNPPYESQWRDHRVFRRQRVAVETMTSRFGPELPVTSPPPGLLEQTASYARSLELNARRRPSGILAVTKRARQGRKFHQPDQNHAHRDRASTNVSGTGRRRTNQNPSSRMSDDRRLRLQQLLQPKGCAGRSIARHFPVPSAGGISALAGGKQGAVTGIACLDGDGQPCDGPDVPSVQERAGAQCVSRDCAPTPSCHRFHFAFDTFFHLRFRHTLARTI